MTARATARPIRFALVRGALVTSLLAACGGPAATAQSTQAASNPTQASAAPATGAVAPTDSTATTPPATVAPTVAAAACVAPPSGIVAWWRAENDPTDAIGTDDGTLKAGATFGTGKVGRAFAFDGAAQYIEVASAPNLQQASAITIEGWVYASGAPASYAGIAGTWDDNAGANRTYLFWVLNGELELIISPDGGSLQRATDPTPLPLDTWTHVAGTYDGTTISVYVDGVEVGHTASAGTIATNGRPFTIGRTDGGSVGSPNYWKGSIDELTVYDRALTAAEIAAVHGAGSAGKCPS